MVRIFSRTKIHTKRFLSRSVSPHKVFSHTKRLLSRSFSPHKVFSHTKRLFTRSVPSNAEFHHSAVGPVAHSDELLYPAQATTPQELDQFRPRRHPATAPRAQLLTLTSSPFNTGGRAPTVHKDKPFTVPQTDGLLPTILIDGLSPQHKRQSSYIHSDEPFTVLQTDGLLPTIPIDELSFQYRRTSSYCS